MLSRGWTVDNTMLTPTRPSEPPGKALLLLCLLGQLPRPQMTPHNQGTWLSFEITDTSLLVYWTHGPSSSERLAQARWSAMLLLQKRSCPSTPKEYTTGLHRRLSASASGRWQALCWTRTASVVLRWAHWDGNAVLWRSSWCTCTWLYADVRSMAEKHWSYVRDS